MKRRDPLEKICITVLLLNTLSFSSYHMTTGAGSPVATQFSITVPFGTNATSVCGGWTIFGGAPS